MNSARAVSISSWRRSGTDFVIRVIAKHSPYPSKPLIKKYAILIEFNQCDSLTSWQHLDGMFDTLDTLDKRDLIILETMEKGISQAKAAEGE
jgi:hypothetical protein